MKGSGLSLPRNMSLGNASSCSFLLKGEPARGTVWQGPEEIGEEEVWGRGKCSGQLTGAENIKIFVFHVNAEEELIKQNTLFRGSLESDSLWFLFLA